jgi:hypothetical protein
MLEEIRFNKLSAAKKILKRCKYLKSPCVLVEERKIKKLKLVTTLIHPPTMSGDVLHDHNAPTPSVPNAVLPASVPSLDSGINSFKSLAYEAIFFMKWKFMILNKKDQEQDALPSEQEQNLIEKNLQL